VFAVHLDQSVTVIRRLSVCMSSSEPWNHEHKCFNVLYKSLVRWASSRIWRNDV